MTETAYKIAAAISPWAPEPLLTAAEVCKWLGIGDTSLRKLAKDKKLIPVPICRHRRYDPADVRRYIEQEKEKARAINF